MASTALLHPSGYPPPLPIASAKNLSVSVPRALSSFKITAVYFRLIALPIIQFFGVVKLLTYNTN